MTEPTIQQFEDCLVVGAIGDALGAEVEFSSWGEIQRRHGDVGLREISSGAGFTDDTQMTLFTAEGLIRTSTRDRAKGITTHIGVVRFAYLRWLHTQGYAVEVVGIDDRPDGWLVTNRLLHQRRAPGNTCLSSLASGRRGTIDEPLNSSKGCGAVMRMAPVGLWYAGRPETAWDLGCDLGAITHGHREGYESAGALAAMVAGLAAGEPLRVAVETALSVAGRAGRTGTVVALEGAMALAGVGAVEPDELCDRLGEGWVGEEALALSVACCMAHDDPFEALVMSINHRGDSDSTGAIAGNLLGLMHGTGWLPDGWTNAVDGIDLVRTVAGDLWTEAHDPPPIEGEGSWFDRYPGW